MAKLPTKTNSTRRFGRTIFSERRFTYGDSAAACFVAVLFTNGHWIAAIITGLALGALSYVLDSYFWN